MNLGHYTLGSVPYGGVGFFSGSTPPPAPSIPTAPSDRTFLLFGCNFFGSKTPEEIINYAFDWSAEIGNDTITSSTWTLSSSDIASSANVFVADVATLLISGGVAGNSYTVTNRINLASGLILDASFVLYVNQFNA